jgi:hypothetical protein
MAGHFLKPGRAFCQSERFWSSSLNMAQVHFLTKNLIKNFEGDVTSRIGVSHDKSPMLKDHVG